jgi:hypothetical protein
MRLTKLRPAWLLAVFSVLILVSASDADEDNRFLKIRDAL